MTYNLSTDLFDEARYFMEATGFYRVPHFVDAAKVEELNAKIDLWFETFAATEGYSPSKFQFFDLDPFFIELMAAPLIIKIGSHFLGEAFRFDHPVGLQQPGRLKLADGSFFVVDAEHGDLHGGPSASQGSCFVNYANGRMWLGQLNVGLVMKKQTRAGGGFCYIPGSHHVDSAPNQGGNVRALLKENFFHEMMCIPDLDVGDLVFFNEAIVHGMTPWKARGVIRRNVYYKYTPGFAVWQPYERIAKFLPMATTEIQRRLLRPPYNASFGDVPTLENHVYREPTLPPKTTREKVIDRAADPVGTFKKIGRRLLR